jgi:DNA-binding GntR family transcriptional regulator
VSELTGERRTAQQLVRDTLRRAILMGQIEGGTRLVQAELAERLQVSTTPVREALRSLAAEGLVRLDAHRGAVVRRLNQAELREIYDLRCVLEPEALRRAIPRITPEQVEEAAAIEAEMNGERDAARWAELNRRFHHVFMEAAGSPRLTQMLETLQDSFAAYIVSSLLHDERRLDKADEQHAALLQAVRDRDTARAEQIMVAHMRGTLDHITSFEP